MNLIKNYWNGKWLYLQKSWWIGEKSPFKVINLIEHTDFIWRTILIIDYESLNAVFTEEILNTVDVTICITYSINNILNIHVEIGSSNVTNMSMRHLNARITIRSLVLEFCLKTTWYKIYTTLNARSNHWNQFLYNMWSKTTMTYYSFLEGFLLRQGFCTLLSFTWCNKLLCNSHHHGKVIVFVEMSHFRFDCNI